jgi:hypothetical protein
MIRPTILAISLLVTAGACKKSADTDRHDTAVKQDLTQTRADFEKATADRIAALNAKIDELEKRGDDKAHATAAALRTRRDEAQARLSTFKESAGTTWDQFKADASRSWEQLEKDTDAALK